MGYRVAQIAIKGREVSDLYPIIGVLPTGAVEEIAESPICGASLADGWYLFYLNDFPRPESDTIKILSENSELLYCDVNETTMTSYASRWDNGIETWSVLHDSGNEKNPIEANGKLPADFLELQTAIERQIANGEQHPDYFELPVTMVEHRIQFRYDGDLPEGGETEFRTLTSN